MRSQPASARFAQRSDGAVREEKLLNPRGDGMRRAQSVYVPLASFPERVSWRQASPGS
jgi:hypothetical protein